MVAIIALRVLTFVLLFITIVTLTSSRRDKTTLLSHVRATSIISSVLFTLALLLYYIDHYAGVLFIILVLLLVLISRIRLFNERFANNTVSSVDQGIHHTNKGKVCDEEQNDILFKVTKTPNALDVSGIHDCVLGTSPNYDNYGEYIG